MTSNPDTTTRNVARWDRAVRIALGLMLLGLGWLGIVSGLWGVALKLFGWVPLITGVVGWCPFYALAEASTRRLPSSTRRRRPPGA